ncbi:sulfatase-like hydrolase/transferase [Cryobacterium sp. TMT4-10]|uniref:sulfatase-like hydrolase/transferase n=1 Tax=Cryobacterium sp. TMT4-10 TaxID=1259256 RepID=UPI0018E0936B|nr:sulfatase-like hydrolase/transferase [Cryobacterium sp. TMT4-10]
MANGKWHLTPSNQETAAGPYTRWPLARGFERFYGFLGGDTSQWYPDLVYDNHQVDPPKTPEDMVPTLLDLLEVKPPATSRGVTQSPLQGVSFVDTLNDQSAPTRHHTQYFEMLGHRAIYHDGWRAVCPWPGPSFAEAGMPFGESITAEKLSELDATGWEVYRVASVPAEPGSRRTLWTPAQHRTCAGAHKVRRDTAASKSPRVRHSGVAHTGWMTEIGFDGDGLACPACGVEMTEDGVDTAEGLESCHRCPRCRLVVVVPGLWST